MNLHPFDIPAQLDGDQLKAHIGCSDVYILEDKLIIGGENLTLKQATDGLASYVYAEPISPTPAEKLFAKTGLTVEEYKALGL